MKNLLINSRARLALAISPLFTHKFVQAFLCSWLIALGAYISIPFYPVPLTLQTFSIALISLVMPVQVAISAVVFYISYAAMGIPVLEGGANGIGALVGPTAGYIVGFILMSATISLLIKRYPASSALKRCLFTLIGGAILFLIGVGYMSHLFSWNIAIKAGLLPFMFSEPIKLALAAYLSKFIQHRYLTK
jgi:biotin transport system substrate-specific component